MIEGQEVPGIRVAAAGTLQGQSPHLLVNGKTSGSQDRYVQSSVASRVGLPDEEPSPSIQTTYSTRGGISNTISTPQ